jgi:hypothetical protein
LQHLLPSPLHIAKSLQRILKRIGHGLPPCRGEVERVKARIVPHRNVDISLAPAACAAPGVLREDEVYWTANQPKADRGVSDPHIGRHAATEGARRGSALQAVSQGSPCAEWCGDVGSQAVRLVLRTSQRTSPRSSRPLTPRALRCCFRSRHRIKPAHGLWLKARAPLGRHQWPAFANRLVQDSESSDSIAQMALVECQSTCPRGRHGERRSWNAASNLSAEPRWIRV